jgi:hypothetical protein
MIEVHVDRVGLIPDSGAMSIFLKDPEKDRVLVIQVGVFEGSAILYGMNKVSMKRPLSHDLMIRLIEDLGAQVKCLLIHDLVDNTYYGEIRLVKDGQEIRVDTRPSDGIALCLRAGAPIYVADKLAEHFIDEMDILMATADSDETVH